MPMQLLGLRGDLILECVNLLCSWNWTSKPCCLASNWWTWPSNAWTLSGRSSSIGTCILANTAVWIRSSICCIPSVGLVATWAGCTGWYDLHGSWVAQGSDSAALVWALAPQSAKVAAEPTVVGFMAWATGSCRCLLMTISPQVVAMMVCSGSSVAWTSHITPRPGHGVVGCSGRLSQLACRRILATACLSTPYGKGPTVYIIFGPLGRNTVSGPSNWWMLLAWLVRTRSPRRSPNLASPVTAGLVCIKCSNSCSVRLEVQTTVYKSRISFPSAVRGSQ